MNKNFKFKKRFIFIPFLAIAFVFLVSYLVMVLWNYTLPSIFGLTTITLWQAMGLFFLCKLLFGFGNGPKRGGPSWKRRCLGKDLSELSETEKEKFQQYIHHERCFWDKSTLRSEFDENRPNHTNHD